MESRRTDLTIPEDVRTNAVASLTHAVATLNVRTNAVASLTHAVATLNTVLLFPYLTDAGSSLMARTQNMRACAGYALVRLHAHAHAHAHRPI